MNPDEHPEIRSWIDSYTGDLDFVDFLTQNCSVGMWLAFSHLVCPKFVEVQGCILWERKYDPENFQTWHRHLDGNIYKIETIINRLVVGDIVQCDDTPEDLRALSDIARAVADCWKATLARAFPSSSFDVLVLDTEDGPTITFGRVSS
ncbi:hypothetical protein [Streptomyces milbemycinicus]|uniref:hypothetical protein n=1 Tax=Streptomyces milbemycinicus TaxID=476552 RepID=UPI0033C42B67